MNTENDNTKRKKRKTRKYLNEIRKRCYRNGSCNLKEHVCKEHAKTVKESIKSSKSINHNINLITRNRLTLSLFPKAVRSETITRPILEEIKHKQNINIKDIVNNNIPSAVLNTSINDDAQMKMYLKKPSSSDTLNEVNTVIHDSNYEDANESPSQFGSFVLYSPIYKNKESEISSSDEAELVIEPRISKVQEDHLKLYESFMKELPYYLLSQNLPKELFRDDIILKNVKAQLHSLSVKESPTNVRCKLNRERIIQNPIEYIRVTQTDADDLNSSSSATNNTSMHSTLIIKTPSILQDTPEYYYYPHKLNH